MTLPKTTISALALAVGLLMAPVQPSAQDTRNDKVILIADSVFLQGSNLLTATGNVEAIYSETTLTASKIVYNGRTDNISIEGPIEITDPSGAQIIAEFAELDADLQNGLIESARLVLNDQLRIEADQLRRIEGRESQLLNATATSCKTCADGQPPLWQIRARRVVHDQDEKQLYFDDAQFRLMDVPVFYVPRLRLPDPTVERATGFLTPSLRSRSRLGLGAKVPYFIALGDHKDLTLTPYIAANSTTLEWRYRQAFKAGEIAFEGALSKDSISTFSSRAYVFGTGQFDLRNDYKLSFGIQRVSDSAYLADYDYADLDRLTSDLRISRVNRNENTQLALTNFDTVRAGEDNDVIPSWVVSARKQKRFVPARLGGEALWELEAHTHYRTSSVDTDANADGFVDGRDVSRVNAALHWRNSWLTSQGFVIGADLGAELDAVHTRQDAAVADTNYLEVTPLASVHLRYPLISRSAESVTQLLEPVVQLGWSGGALRSGSSTEIANDESTRVEFDEGNLLALSRFPSDDRRERGLVAAWGVNWARLAPDWSMHLTLGQVVRQDSHPDFSETSGLQETYSDFLVASKFQNASGLEFTARALVDGIDGLNKAEARGGWQSDLWGVDASYIWLSRDLAENRTSDLSEWNFDGSYRMNRHWTGLANWQYDIATNSTSQAGIGFEYQNECIRSKFEVSRRFTSTTTVQPATDISFTVEILGFTTRTNDKSYARTCEHSAG